jgi:hypothetical protein
MYKEYKLKHFFLCVLLLVIGIGSFIAYAWRRNAPGNLYDENGVDVSTPFYANPRPENPHTQIGTNQSTTDLEGDEEASHEENAHEAPDAEEHHEGH